ncbi:MAG: aspartate kinase, partial [Candidatus Cloacimonetes bacterium]|nr:aspartate kinase [Candidatus Cloacimonadota bacterium]
MQKFGGTSLQNEAGRLMALEKIRSAIEEGFSPVIVVSAIGRKGDPYSTDTLIDEAKKCLIDIKKREKDLLTSCGEIISAVLMVQRLRAAKLDAIALTGFQAGIITDDNFGNARVNKVNPSKILSCLQNGKIPVIAGYQGISESFEITTLGRGGSDTTAAIVAAALKADKIEIYSDVNGLMTADPTIVESAILLNEA